MIHFLSTAENISEQTQVSEVLEVLRNARIGTNQIYYCRFFKILYVVEPNKLN